MCSKLWTGLRIILDPYSNFEPDPHTTNTDPEHYYAAVQGTIQIYKFIYILTTRK